MTLTTKQREERKRERRVESEEWTRSLKRGRWVKLYPFDYLIPANVHGLAFISEVNRLKRLDPVTIAVRSGRDVIDARSRKPWHPDQKFVDARAQAIIHRRRAT